MKNAFTQAEIPDVVRAAQIAAPESESFWDRIADYFDRSRENASRVVQPRVTKDKS
jgi:hypothetical protein